MPLPKGQMLLACIIMHSPFILFLKETPRVNIEFCSIWKWSYVIWWTKFEPLVTSFEYLNVHTCICYTLKLYSSQNWCLQQKGKKNNKQTKNKQNKLISDHKTDHKADRKFQINNNTIQVVDFCTSDKKKMDRKSCGATQKLWTEDKTNQRGNSASHQKCWFKNLLYKCFESRMVGCLEI